MLKAQINELDSEYHKSSRSAAKLERIVDDKGVKMSNLGVALRHSEDKVHSLNGTITRFCQDLDKVVSMSDEKKWRNGLLNLYQTYVLEDAEKVRTYKPSKGAIEEFNRQRKLMERGLAEARKTSNRVVTNSSRDNAVNIF